MRDLNDLTRPTVPSGAIQQHVFTEAEEHRGVVSSAPALPGDTGAPTALHAVLGQVVAELAPQIVELSHDIHSRPETGYEEHHTATTTVEPLRRHGVGPEVDIYGMDTALRIEIPGGGDVDTVAEGSCELTGTIAILAEYDILPGIGHGYEHNVMRANSVDAFLTLAVLIRTRPGSLPGRVVLQTTPTEENSAAKEILAVRGMLDGADAAIQTHSYAHDITHRTWLDVRHLRVIFHGVPARAVSRLFMDRNVLGTAALTLTGIDLLRQQMFPMDRFHATITNGGQASNTIPKRTELSITMCLKYLETLKEIAERVEEVLHGAVLMTGTGAEVLTPEYCDEVSVYDNGSLLTSQVHSQHECDRDPLVAGVLPGIIAVGTDFGNTFQHIPGIHLLIKVTNQPDVALHTPVMAETASAPTRDAAALGGAYELAAVALDWLHDAELRRAVHADFEATGGTVDIADFWEE